MAQAQLSSQNASYGSGFDREAPVATLVYRSQAVTPLSAPDLYRLTMEAQARNRREAITGVMLYDDSRFFQWLEGPVDGVGRVMHSIRNDPRHTNIEVLNDKTSRERAFGDWSMKLAARFPKPASWSDDILEAPVEIVNDLRQRPDAAPAVLIKLVPRSRDRLNTAAIDQFDPAPLGRAAAAILKSVIQSVIIPDLAGQHGLLQPHSQGILVNPRVSELADLLVASDQAAARELIDELHAAEGSIWPLYSTLFEPAARKLGDLWAEDLCSEFEVTLGLCRIQTAARLLSAPAQLKSGQNSPAAAVLIAPEPGELHQLGAALDSEVLWNAGWSPRSEYPVDDKTLQDLVSESWFDALDVSLSSAFRREHLIPRLTKTIKDARRASLNPSLLIVVGGRTFVEHYTSGAQVGADITSMTALNLDDLITDGIAKRDANARQD
jgi:methanogenic corrinoid protein MtbC1